MERTTKRLPTMRKSSSKVSFSDMAETLVVEPHTGPQNESWYTTDEIRAFRKTQRSKSDTVSSKEYVRSLLSIQQMHQDMGIQDPRGLRQMSRAFSKDSMKKAIERAHDILHEED